MSGVGEGEAAAPADYVWAPTPFAKATLSVMPAIKIPLRDYALAYIKHHDVLHETSRANTKARQLAFYAMGDALKVSYSKVKLCLPQFRKTFYQCMVELLKVSGKSDVLWRAPYWAQLLEKKLNMLPRAQEEVSLHRMRKKSSRLTPSGALRLMAAYCRRHRVLCSGALYAELRQALRCGCPASQLHAVWVAAQRVCVRQLAALCRAGDVPGPRGQHAPLQPPARRVADLVLLYTDVDALRILTDESVTLYDELQALTTLFTLVQKHGVEHEAARDPAEAGRRWTRLYREYVAGGKVTSLVVLQRRWHELKLQTRARLVRYVRDARASPPPALLHVDIARRYPAVVRGEAASWRQMVADGLVTEEPVDDEPAPSQACPDGSFTEGRPAATADVLVDDNEDDDVQLIEKQVPTIDVDSASDTEDIDNTTDKTNPADVQTQDSNAVKDQNYNENTISMSLKEIIIPTLIRRLINECSVRPIHNRVSESVNRQTNIVTNDTATPSTSAVKNIDSDHTLALLETLDPSKVSTEIIFESDSDDDALDNQPSSVYSNDQDANELQIVISDVTSNSDDVKINNVADVNNINSSVDVVTQVNGDTSGVAQVDTPNSNGGHITVQNANVMTIHKDDINTFAHTNIDTNNSDQIGKATENINSGNNAIACTNNGGVVADKHSNDDPKDVIAHNVDDNQNNADVVVMKSDDGNDTAVAMDIDSECNSNVEPIINSSTVVGITCSESMNATIDSQNGIPNNAVAVNSVTGDAIDGSRANSSNNSESDSRIVTGEPKSTAGSERGGEQGYDKFVDPKLFMETRVNLIRIHNTDEWRKHFTRDIYIDDQLLRTTTSQPAAANHENRSIQIKVNSTDKTINIAYSDTALHADPGLAAAGRGRDNYIAVDSLYDEQIDYQLSDDESVASAADSTDDMFVPGDESDDFTNSDGSSEDDVVLAHYKTVSGAKQSRAAGAVAWSDTYDSVFRGGREKRQKRERVAKKVQLTDIEEVRRVNRNILTAQVAPITAADVDDSTTTAESFSDKAAVDTVGGDAPADKSVGANEPGEQSVPMVPMDEPSGAAEPGDEPTNASQDEDWPDGVVPTRKELKRVLNKLSSELRRQGPAGGLPAPGYCCAARRQRSVQDALRRICPRAPPPQLQLHAHRHAGPCDCCCRRLLQAPRQRARLRADLARLRRDLRRLLGSAAPSASSSSADGSKKRKKNGKSKNKSNKDDRTTQEPTNVDPLAEWERQKALNAQYFHIEPITNRKRQRDTTKKDNDVQPTAAGTETIDVVMIEEDNTAETNSNVIDITEDSNDSQRSPAAAGPVTEAELQDATSTECIPEKIMKLTADTQTPFSLVVTDLNDPRHQFRTLLKLHTNSNSMLNPMTLAPVVSAVNTVTQAGGVVSMPNVITVPDKFVRVPSSGVGKLVSVPGSTTSVTASGPQLFSLLSNTANVSGASGNLVRVPSSATGVTAPADKFFRLLSNPTSVSTVRSTLMNVPNSAANVTASGRQLVSLLSNTASVNSVPGTLVSAPNRAARVTASEGQLVSLLNNTASINAVPDTLENVPNSAASVPASGGHLVSLLNDTASVNAVPSTLASVPNSAVSVTASGGHLVSLLNTTASVNAVPDTSVNVQNIVASVTAACGHLVTLLNNTASVSAVPDTLVNVPNTAASVTTSGGHLVSLLNNTASVSTVLDTLVNVPNTAASVTTSGGHLVSLLNNTASVSAVPDTVVNVPNTAASVTTSGGHLVSLLNNTASVSAVPDTLVNVPNTAASVTTSGGHLVSLLNNTASVSAVPDTLVNVPNTAASVTTSGGHLVSLLNNTASVYTVPGTSVSVPNSAASATASRLN